MKSCGSWNLTGFLLWSQLGILSRGIRTRSIRSESIRLLQFVDLVFLFLWKKTKVSKGRLVFGWLHKQCRVCLVKNQHWSLCTMSWTVHCQSEEFRLWRPRTMAHTIAYNGHNSICTGLMYSEKKILNFPNPPLVGLCPVECIPIE